MDTARANSVWLSCVVRLSCTGLFLFIFSINYAFAQVIPSELANLNCRIIGFIDSSVNKGEQSTLEIAVGTVSDPVIFGKQAIIRKYFSGNKVIAEVPEFGTTYTWRITGNGRSSSQSSLHHFSVNQSAAADTTQFRMRVIKDAGKFKDYYVFADGNSALYDMKGNVVWVLPLVPNDEVHNRYVRDLKMSKDHTITLLFRDQPHEIDWSGKIRWVAPVVDKDVIGDQQFYHHEFTKLRNGHYMVCGNEQALRADIGKRVMFGTVIEYDAAGLITFRWSSFELYNRFFSRLGHKTGKMQDAHMNSFFLDESKKILYVSFKNTSHIIKVSYPDGKVLNKFGRRFSYDTMVSYFYEQHAIGINNAGNIYMFNNHNKNRSLADYKPRISVFRELGDSAWTLLPVWEYVHKPRGAASLPAYPVETIGGNAIELPNSNYFGSMCEPYSDLFIVNQKKELQWLAVMEWKREDHWENFTQYRCSIISRDDLEKMIWSSVE